MSVPPKTSLISNSDNFSKLDRKLDSARDQNERDMDGRDLHDPDHRSPIFHFVRIVKSIPELADETALDAFYEVELWLQRKGYVDMDEAWQQQFGRVGIDSAEDACVECVHLWDEILYPAGYGPLQMAWERAQVYRLQPENCRTPGYASFISLAGNLQKLRGPKPIWLPCLRVGELLDVSAMPVSRYRAWAVQDMQMRVLRPHTLKPYSCRAEATEFHFNLDRYPREWHLEWRGGQPGKPYFQRDHRGFIFTSEIVPDFRHP